MAIKKIDENTLEITSEKKDIWSKTQLEEDIAILDIQAEIIEKKDLLSKFG